MVVAHARCPLFRCRVEMCSHTLVDARLARQSGILKVGYGTVVPDRLVATATAAAGETCRGTQHSKTEITHCHSQSSKSKETRRDQRAHSQLCKLTRMQL